MLPREVTGTAFVEQSGRDAELFIVKVQLELLDKYLVADGGAVLNVSPIQGLHYRTFPPQPIILLSARGSDGIDGADAYAIPRMCWVPLNMIGGGTVENHVAKLFWAVDVGGLLFAIWPYTGTHIVS